ncbi:hypothetical protein QP185_05895 [Sphingomonas aerolata]|uniref:hypothetical protein n=1 Tax=Sphingomonas aerolata TaxID=185951 RepID=UPI002FE29255
MLLSVPIYKVLVVGKLFPKRFDSIRIRLPEHTPDRIRDFLWEASLLGHFSSEINSFVVYRSRYESALFAADYETCESTLNELEACHGLSLWLVDARINLLQMKDGLSAQRSYLEGLIESPGVDRVPAYLAFWFSHRTDPNVSAQSIADEAEEVRNAFGGTSIPGDFFTSFIDPANTFAIGQPHHCIYGANDAPSLTDT